MWLLLMRLLLGTWPATQACVLTGNGTSDLSIRRQVLNLLSHTSQGQKDVYEHEEGYASGEGQVVDTKEKKGIYWCWTMEDICKSHKGDWEKEHLNSK